MKTILFLSLLSVPAVADEAKANNNSANYCSNVVDTRPAASCAVKVCKQGLLCDFNCAEKHADEASKWQQCRTSCWERTVERMKSCS